MVPGTPTPRPCLRRISGAFFFFNTRLPTISIQATVPPAAPAQLGDPQQLAHAAGDRQLWKEPAFQMETSGLICGF